MSEAPDRQPGAHEYRLFVREGPPRFFFRNNDEGIWLSEHGVGWCIGGISHTRDWSALSRVHLSVNFVPKQGPFGSCVLYFSDGTALSVLTASKWGGADLERNAEYGRFLTDFHRMIPQALRPKIFFQCGASETRHMMMKIAVAVAAIFFGLLPLGLLIYFRSWEMLAILGAGAAFIWPLFHTIKATEPGTYNPNAVPEHLFP